MLLSLLILLESVLRRVQHLIAGLLLLLGGKRELDFDLEWVGTASWSASRTAAMRGHHLLIFREELGELGVAQQQ